MMAVDTNVLVRLITHDDSKQALRAQHALDAELEAGRECMVGHIVVCEVMWVLKGLYRYSLAQCQATLAALLAFPGLRFEALPVFLLVTSVLMAVYYPDLFQEKVALPIALCVVVVSLSEMIPFSPMPTFTNNAITNRDGPYRGAFRASFNASIFAVLIILGISVLQVVVGNSSPGVTTEWSWMQSESLSKLVPSVLMLVIPIVYMTYSAVNIFYREAPIYRPLDPNVYSQEDVQSL